MCRHLRSLLGSPPYFFSSCFFLIVSRKIKKEIYSFLLQGFLLTSTRFLIILEQLRSFPKIPRIFQLERFVGSKGRFSFLNRFPGLLFKI